MSAADIYAQCLLPLKEGYPLYRPELHRRLNDDVYDTYRREGISIGDVGIIRPGGDFDFLFNICRTGYHNRGNVLSPSDGPLSPSSQRTLNTTANSEQLVSSSTTGDSDGPSPRAINPSATHEESGRMEHLTSRTTPVNFELIDAGEISITPNYVSSERPYLAHGREEQTTFNAEASLNPIAVTPIGVGLDVGWTFECSSQQGAIMVAPDGATLTEVLEEERFLRSIESVGNWFKYAAEERHRRFKSLILVTGVVKCRSWSVAAISTSSRAQSGKVALSLMPSASGTLTASHSWREYIPTMCHSGPKPPSQAENQCVFVRGYRIMKQDPLLRLRKKVRATDLQEGNTEYYKLGKSASFRGTSASGTSNTDNSTSPGHFLNDRMSNIKETDPTLIKNEDYVVERLSNTNEPYHPSDVINRYLLEQVPDADFAMTHDKHWWTLMKDMELSCPNERELLARVRSTYKAVLRYGVVCLQEDPGHEDSVVTTTGTQLSSQACKNTTILSGEDPPTVCDHISAVNDGMVELAPKDSQDTCDLPSSHGIVSTTQASSSIPPPDLSISYPRKPEVHPSEKTSSESTVLLPIENILLQGNVVGEGMFLQGEHISVFPTNSTIDFEAPAKGFEVVRNIDTGTYAVIYQVREVLVSPMSSTDCHSLLDGTELDDSVHLPMEYGRDFALKCFSKVNLDNEALVAQMAEITIHQSLRPHPNIVTLYQTLETSSYFLLLLEFVPGMDLFYFLEQGRDYCDPDSPSPEQVPTSSNTILGASFISNIHPSQLLCHDRLQLIASMFSQMCDAVAECHDQQVFHRDIKPENFTVTDGWSTLPDGSRERDVVVKLCDFELSTTDLESSDMDCGSAPYMSYECRNKVAPTYKPRAADVWSLGIVLINMLYRFNPWTDTAHGACHSFELYRWQPVEFFVQRFAGMTYSVAEYLSNNVFCILDDPKDDMQRVEARDFGIWIKDLPSLLACTSTSGQVSALSMYGLPVISPVPPFSRGSWGKTFLTEVRSGIVIPHSRSRSPSPSLTKERKRGRRKRSETGAPTPQQLSPDSPIDITLESTATASQSLLVDRGIYKSDEVPASPIVTKKASKWKLSVGKDSPSGGKLLGSPVYDVGMSGTNDLMPVPTASNVTNLIMGLNPSAPVSSGVSRRAVFVPAPDLVSPWARGRPPIRERSLSPSQSSIVSSNWRNSTSATSSSSSSVSTRYSNSSSRSVSTQATSVSASSSRSLATRRRNLDTSHQNVLDDGPTRQIPKNVKVMTGLPWELGQLPRQMHPNPLGNIFGSPPRRPSRRRRAKDQLGTIGERPDMPSKAAVPMSEDHEVIKGSLNPEPAAATEDEDGAAKKVEKGQINALAKMLSTLRR